MHVYKNANSKPIYIFQLQKSNIYLVYICCSFFIDVLFLKLVT